MPSELDRHLRFLLLEGQERPSVAFPRRQFRADSEGFLPLKRMFRRERWELAHSLASLKRNLPAGCRRCTPTQLDEWRRRVSTPSPPSSPDYLRFVRKTVGDLFPYAWDKAYESFVEGFVPCASARKERRQRADRALARRGGDKEFRRNAVAGKGFDCSPLTARYKEVLSAGRFAL